MRPTWIHRPLLNWIDLYRWGIDSGIEEMMRSDHLHVTLATARTAVDADLVIAKTDTVVIPAGEKPLVPLGQSARCLSFDWQPFAERHYELGSIFPIDFPGEYLAHVTIVHDGPCEPLFPYRGELIFGPEIVAPFISGLPVGRFQNAINRNVFRERVGLPPHDDAVAKSTEWRAIRAKRKIAQTKKKTQAARLSKNEERWARKNL